MFNGFINLNKQSGMSSNRALSVIKKVLNAKEKEIKVGHLGTLDPLACGVLPVAIGKSTRLFDYCLNKTKRYRARFTFGYTSESYDLATELIKVDGEEVTLDKIKTVLPQFLGKIDQIPPLYSAKSIGGVRAYKLARKGADIELPSKQIEIYSIEVLSQTDTSTYEFIIECSSGTYIRSIARDLGERLGTQAVMSYLCRERSGEFTLENSFMEEDILRSSDQIEKLILSPEIVLSSLPKYVLKDDEIRVLDGIKIPCEITCPTRIYLPDQTLVGIGRANETCFLHIDTRLL